MTEKRGFYLHTLRREVAYFCQEQDGSWTYHRYDFEKPHFYGNSPPRQPFVKLDPKELPSELKDEDMQRRFIQLKLKQVEAQNNGRKNGRLKLDFFDAFNPNPVGD